MLDDIELYMKNKLIKIERKNTIKNKSISI